MADYDREELMEDELIHSEWYDSEEAECDDNDEQGDSVRG